MGIPQRECLINRIELYFRGRPPLTCLLGKLIFPSLMNTLGATVVLASNDVLLTSGPSVAGACFWVLEATHQKRPTGTY